MSFKDLAEVELGKLSAAVEDWGDTVKGLKVLARNAHSEMFKRAKTARWAGENATVTREFVKKTAKEFSDAHVEADSIWRVLKDAHAELSAIQKNLRTVLNVEVRELGVTVSDVGDGKVHVFFPRDRSRSEAQSQGDLEAAQELADKIAGLVSHAKEIDDSVSRALRKSHGSDMGNFGHKKYESLDDAQQQRATELAKLGPEISDKQFSELNSIMKWNAKDSDFSTAFYNSLGGPRDALEYYGRMALDGTDGDDKSRLALTRNFQENMGTALASATDPDRKAHLPATWATEFRKLGTQEIPLQDGAARPPYGYQILGGMLRYGNYDEKFINPIAEHLVQLHHKDPDRFMGNKPMAGGDLDWGFNPSGESGAGYDPLTSVLEGLGHSPEAAKEFFSEETPSVYRDDGTIDRNGTLDYDYFDELTNKEFEWPPDSLARPGDDAVEQAREGGPNALGHALEAATLGRAYDDPTPQLARDETSARIMERVVHTYNDPDQVKKYEVMSDSLGRMGAGYIDDINWSVNDNRGDSIFAPTKNQEEHGRFGQSDSLKFLSTLGQHPDAYSEISMAEKVYSMSGLEAQVGSDGINESHARELVRTGAEVQGILDQSRADQILAEGLARDEEYNDSMDRKAGWIQFGAGVGVATGAAFLPPVAAAGVAGTLIPIFVESGQGAAEQQIGNIIDDVAQTHHRDGSDEYQEQRSEIFRAGKDVAGSPMEQFIQRHGISRDNGEFGQNLEEALEIGYQKGTAGEDQQGVLPKT